MRALSSGGRPWTSCSDVALVSAVRETMIPLALRRDDDDFYPPCRIGQLGFHSGARRRVAARHPGVPRFVHAGEVRQVGDVDGGAEDAGFVAAGFGQQAVDMTQHLAGLALDV